jgi:outer membrane protease
LRPQAAQTNGYADIAPNSPNTAPIFPNTQFFALNAAEGPGSEKNFSFSTEALFGVIYGQGQEIVYNADAVTYLSELLWDIKPLFYAGAALFFSLEPPSWPVGLYTNLLIKTGFSGRSGDMEDRDWISTHLVDPNGDYFLTHYSKHDNYIRGGTWFFDGDLGISFPLKPGNTFDPELSVFCRVSYMDLRWTSENGYLQYGSKDEYGKIIRNGADPKYPYTQKGDPNEEWKDTFAKEYLDGPAIQYSQRWFLFSPGIAIDLAVARFLSLGASFTITPLLRADAEDIHFKMGTQYNDYPQGGLALEPQVRVVLFPASPFSVTLNASYRSISGAKGETWQRNYNTQSTPILVGAGGAGYHALDAGISLKINF